MGIAGFISINNLKRLKVVLLDLIMVQNERYKNALVCM